MHKALPILQLRHKRCWRPALLVACGVMAVVAVTRSQTSSWLAPRWACWRAERLRVVRRYFDFENLARSVFDPKFKARDDFVGRVYKEYLPRGPNRDITVIDVEPVEQRYWCFLKEPTRKWHVGTMATVGKTVEDLDPVKYKDMMVYASVSLTANFEMRQWSSKSKGGISDTPRGSVDVACISDGALSRMGGDAIKRSLKAIAKSLKDDGGILFVCNREDQLALGCRLEMIDDHTALRKLGYEVVGSEREGSLGLVAGMMKPLRRTKSFLDSGDTPTTSRARVRTVRKDFSQKSTKRRNSQT